MSINKITIRGEQKAITEISAVRGESKPGKTPSSLIPEAVYELGGSNRDVQQEIPIELDGKVLEFTFDDGTTWMCDSATLHELYPEAESLERGSNKGFVIPSGIKDAANERGIFGEIAAKVLKVFAKKAINSGVRAVAEKLEEKHLGEREGLNFLNKAFEFKKFDNTAKVSADKPFLLFIHGTNSDTKGAFGDLSNADVWNYIHTTYDKNVLAFEHRTLSQSPLQNAVALAGQLPDGAELHLISHSRGGLVGDILCRYSNDNNNNIAGFSADSIQLLKKEGNRDADIECIKALNEIYKTKKVTVKKFIRIASPAAGTKLASKRLDQLLNVLYNILGRDLNDAGVILKELIAETLKTKENVNVLPGIEAMRPESPFIKILNDRADETAIDGSSLAVISGNGKLSVSFRGLLIILGKLFYQQRNDLVVNTDSMYLGARRRDNIQYFFDEGKTVDHITYFKNDKTREAIAYALKEKDGNHIPGFSAVPQYEIPASDRAVEGGELLPYEGVPTGKKPILILLPGIMGSNLASKEDKIWLSYLSSVFGGLRKLEYSADNRIKATSLIKTSYKKLAERLKYTYDVIIYPFDWRKQLNECANEFNDRVTELLKLNQPIKIIGHSMGGVLVRDFIINHDETWKKLNASNGFRLLFLGSPLGGSFRIPAVLFGNDAIINALNMLDRVHTKKELVSIFVNFPGILSLLPLTKDAGNDFAETETWEKMREAHEDNLWPIPNKANLETFKKYRDNILEKNAGIDYSNTIYIAGKDKYTPCGYYNDEIPPRRELVFLYTGEGDQSVTWESGIPKEMKPANIYYVNASHGALANETSLFDGIEELLDKGSTSKFSNGKPAIRGEEKKFRMPDVYSFDLSERALENAVFGIVEENQQKTSNIPLSVSVSKGDLAYASFPVLAGHFMNDGILYAERTIDKMMNGTLSARHALGIYPGPVGTSTSITLNMEETGFPGTIIAGLGEPGTLTAYQLTQTVEQAISKYLLDLNNTPNQKNEIGISALVIASDFGGLTIESSVKAIIEGINNANTKVSEVKEQMQNTVQYLEFIELYEDRALNCMYALNKIEQKENRIYNIRLGNKKIKELFGCKKRIPVAASEDWWNRITIKYRKAERETDMQGLIFGASTGDAREEEKELFSSTSLINLFIEQVSTDNNWSECSAKTLFELMIPNDFKDRLKRKGNITWLLDKDTAVYPWELLQDSSANAKPLCVNAGMIRQLVTPNYRVNINRVSKDKALIIADPLLYGFAGQLGGAESEGKTVRQLMDNNGYAYNDLISKTSPEIVQSLFCDNYRIIHLAGHGIYNPAAPRKSGMVIGKEMFLTTFDIEQMNIVPELVFVNCCHLGKTSGEDERFYTNRYQLAANIGTQLIQMGVKAVIAAGWAVSDAAALDFATEFYANMFAGKSFGDAVKEARRVIYERYHNLNNTWGAYQCYGDPFYKLINRANEKKRTDIQYIMAEEIEIDLDNLINDLDTKNYTCKAALEKLKKITEAMNFAAITADVLERKATIYYELGEYILAVDAFDELRQSENAKFTVSSLEKFCNARCKKYIQDFKTGVNTAAALIKEINTVIGELEKLLGIKSTGERNTLLGSAYKRKGLLCKKTADKLEAYNNAAMYYYQAYEKTGSGYPYKNWLILQNILDITDTAVASKINYPKEPKTETIKKLEERRRSLKLPYRNMDYWEVIEDAAIDFALLILDRHKSKDETNWIALENKYKRIWKKAGSRGKKKAELENFEIIANLLSIIDDNYATYLKTKIDELINSLQRSVEE